MSAQGLGLRVLPPSLFGSRARSVLERNLFVYKHIWIVLFSGFFEPLFYLFAARVGLGELVGDVRDGAGGRIGYAEFVAPALLAASAMNGAAYESTMNIFFKLKYGKIYDAMLATPVQPFDIALGEIAWSLARGAIYATGFILVMWVMGLLRSPLALLAFPASLLIGFAFAGAGMAATSFMRSWQDFDLVNLVILVLFLFSATFYPLSVYPPALQFVGQLSPLYHGVVLIRSFTLGTVQPSLLWNALFLAVMGSVGLGISAVRLKKLLTP
jgi:lipooligosaccharide transport system permease protein